MNGLMQGKTILVMGVASSRSIGWGIARSLHAAGAQLIFTYRKQRSQEQLHRLLAEAAIVPLQCIACDADAEESIEEAFRNIAAAGHTLDGLAHCIAYADSSELQGSYLDTSLEGYLLAHRVSAYSLVAIARQCRKLMPQGGSIVTQSYLGAERAVPNYNVMGAAKASLEASVKYLARDLGAEGIRVNAISAGPVRTLSAKGVSGFNQMLGKVERESPLKRNVTAEEVGDASLFLLSHLSRGITGEIVHVDAGYHCIG